MIDEEPFKIHVTPVKYVKTAWFMGQLVHCICVMDRSGGNMNEHRNGSSDIWLLKAKEGRRKPKKLAENQGSKNITCIRRAFHVPRSFPNTKYTFPHWTWVSAKLVPD